MAVRRARSFLALYIVIMYAAPAQTLIDDALDIIKLSKEIGEEVLNSWDLLGKPFNVSRGVELPIVRRREREVLARLAQVTRAIERLELAVDKTASIALLLKTAGRETSLELQLSHMSDLLGRVASADRQMREYVRYQQELERSTLEDFASWCVSHDPGALPGLLERVHALVVPPHQHLLGRGLLQLVLEDLKESHPDLCQLQLSPHQLIFDMYNTISLTEIKGYAMMQFSWMLLRIYGKGNFTQEASLTRQRYGERTTQTAAAAKAALSMAKRDVYRCDPPQHKEGETYAEVTRLLQGYIENEVDMNPEKTCRDNCAYYTLTENYGCFKDKQCARQSTCKGRILNCQYIDSDMWICPASSRNSTRRYEWIEYENGRTLGRTSYCMRGASKVDSWWRWLFWHCSYCMCLCDESVPESHRYFSLWDTTSDVRNNKWVDSWWRWNLLHCSYCMCLCEDTPRESERFFSMREATSDIKASKVVTGLRLIKLGRVFHLQISEGTLHERGQVTPGGWVPLQKFDPNDSGIKDGIDYHMLTYEKRAIDLDELDSPAGSILTGVRFRLLGPNLHFEIRSTPFNYTTGRLYADKSEWMSNDNTDASDAPRKRLELYQPDIPTRSSIPLNVDSTHDQFVEFTHSDLEADAAQSTVPFVDIQPVMPMKGSSLASGAGIIHRGARGSGGFIATKLFTYDYSRHVRADPPPGSFDEGETTEFVPIVN